MDLESGLDGLFVGASPNSSSTPVFHARLLKIIHVVDLSKCVKDEHQGNQPTEDPENRNKVVKVAITEHQVGDLVRQASSLSSHARR